MPINGSTRELILAYAQEGRSQRWIAQETGIARNTVAKIIAEGPTEGGSKTVAVAQKWLKSTQPSRVRAIVARWLKKWLKLSHTSPSCRRPPSTAT